MGGSLREGITGEGNVDTERVMRAIKEDLIWLNEFSSFKEAKERIGEWIGFYNSFIYIVH